MHFALFEFGLNSICILSNTYSLEKREIEREGSILFSTRDKAFHFKS